MKIAQAFKASFAAEVLSHYNFMDRQQGYIMAPYVTGKLEKTPLMTVSVGIVSPQTHFFSDIREITELAAEERRQDIKPAGE